MSSGRLVGVDGWSGGWVTVTLDRDWACVADHPTFTDVLIAAADADVIGVDSPIGLPSSPGRLADQAARTALSLFASRVFPTFPREVISATTYAEAVARCGDGPKISRQSYGLRTKISRWTRSVRIRGSSRSATRLLPSNSMSQGCYGSVNRV